MQPLSAQSWPETRTKNALGWLASLDISAQKLGLLRIERLLMTLGNPQNKLKVIHIGGTNGKGSCSALLSSVLKSASYRVGSFISPHLVCVRERIQLQGEPIPEADFCCGIERLRAHLDALAWPREEWPTYFEFLTALAWVYFVEKNVEVVVMEVGLGGRLDSTNCVSLPMVSVITTIGLDHQEHLGPTLADIAREKAGIIKPGCPLVLGPAVSGESREAIAAVFEACQGRPANPQNGFYPVSTGRVNGLSMPFSADVRGQRVLDTARGKWFHLPLLGTYQQDNLATVLTVVQLLRQQGWSITDEALAEGIANTHWPARLQWLAEKRWFLDGSHNPDGFHALMNTMEMLVKDRPLYWVVSLRSNRPMPMLARLVSHFSNTRGCFCTRSVQKGLSKKKGLSLYHSPESLKREIILAWHGDNPGGSPSRLQVDASDDLDAALAWLTRQTQQNPEAVGVITGSLYTAGDVLSWLGHGMAEDKE